MYAASHPRKLTAAVTLLLAGFGVTAFGIAPLAPDASDLPRRLVTESVAVQGLEAQLNALADSDLSLYRNDLSRASDTADSLLRRLGVSDVAAAAFLRSDPIARRLIDGRAGKMVQVSADASGQLQTLVALYAPASTELADTHFTRLRITRKAGQLSSSVQTVALSAQILMGSGTIQSTLFSATDEARIPESVANQLADMFSHDIDFQRLRRGDTFSVLYEALTADGEPITWGNSARRVIAAEFFNSGRSHSAVWFKDSQGKGSYFGFDGRTKQRSFLASPMEFSRVTSGFAMRMHPILNQWKQHKGIDFGAPTGTSVRSVGAGTVDFAGWQNGYGNVVEIKHSNDRSTLYAHLNRIAVQKGQHVEQGASIGTVGATGWATGPHLHFEYKVAGQNYDPTSIAKSAESVSVAPASMAQFAKLSVGFRSQLDIAQAASRGGYTE